MQRPMTWSTVTWAKLMLVMTFVAAAFFVAPIADAATCMPERPAADHTLVDHDPSSGDHTSKGADHGLCAHGHCHHTAGRTPADDVLALPGYAEPVHALWPNDILASISSDGLKRPPRG